PASGFRRECDADDQSDAPLAAGALSRSGTGGGGSELVRDLKRTTARARQRTGRGNSAATGRFRSDATCFRKVCRRKDLRSTFRHALSERVGSVGETESGAA